MTLQDLKELFEMERTEEDKARFADNFWSLYSQQFLSQEVNLMNLMKEGKRRI